MRKDEFDSYAASYEAELEKGVGLSGEDSLYFARARLLWLQHRLQPHGLKPGVVMDYGCGVGNAIPLIQELLAPDRIIGVDVSDESLRLARQAHGSDRVLFVRPEDHLPLGQIDIAYTNGTFHHIPPGDRRSALLYIHRAMRPGGMLAFWENNPLNPGTRMVMRRIPFDRDAIMLRAGEAIRLLASSGFRIRGRDYCFVFPGCLRRMRWLEPRLTSLPLGAQYMVLAVKPGTGMVQ